MIRILVLCSMLTGCATAPNWLANLYDSNDPCQQTHRVELGTYPSYCGGGSSKYVTRDYTTGKYLTTTKVQK